MNDETTVDTEVAEAPEPEVVETDGQVAEPVEGHEDAATSEDVEERKPSRAEKRINELTRQRYEEARLRQEAEQRLRALESQIQQQQVPPEVGEMPKLADYDYDEGKYQQALTQWYQGQRQTWERQQQQAWQQHQQQAQEQQRQMALQQKVMQAAEKYPDWQQKVMDPSLPPLRQINPDAFAAIADSDHMADIAYYLASNPQDIYEFANMTPVQVGRKVAALEAKFTQKPQQPYQPPPNPPSKVSGKSENVVRWENPKDRQRMSTDQWIEERNKQLRNRGP